MSPGPIQLDQATALTLMLGPNGSVGIQARGASGNETMLSSLFSDLTLQGKQGYGCELTIFRRGGEHTTNTA